MECGRLAELKTGLVLDHMDLTSGRAAVARSRSHDLRRKFTDECTLR
jgi:hypothetical protein